jgi:hypothetical protein
MKGSNDASETAEVSANDLQPIGETSDGETVVAGQMPGRRATADANIGETQSRTEFGADATRKVDDPARTPDDVAHQTLEQVAPEADGPTMMMKDPHSGDWEEVEGTATAAIERMQAEQAELARLSQLADPENRDPQAVRDMQARRARECRTEVSRRSLTATESRRLPWQSVDGDIRERLVQDIGRASAEAAIEERHQVKNTVWRETVPVSEIPRPVWRHLDDVYQEEAGYSVEAAVETERVAAPRGAGSGAMAEREVLKRVPRSALREAFRRHLLAEYGEDAERMYEKRLSVYRERVGYRVEPQGRKELVVADIARGLAAGKNDLRAVNEAMNKWFANGVHRVQDIGYTEATEWPAVSTRGIVVKRFDDVHPSMEAAFIVADPQSGAEAKVTVWHQTLIAKASTRFPGQSAEEADGNGDKAGVLDIPEEGQRVLLENVKPGWYSGQPTFAVTSDSVMTPLDTVEEYDPSDEQASDDEGRESAPTVAGEPAPAADLQSADEAAASAGDVAEAVAAVEQATVGSAGETVAAGDDEGGEMSAYVEAVYHYAQSLRQSVEDYEAMHEAVEQTPPPSRDDYEDSQEASDADVAAALADGDDPVDSTVAEAVAEQTDGVTDTVEAPERVRYAYDREPPEE